VSAPAAALPDCPDAGTLDDGYRHCASVLAASGSSFAAAFWMLEKPQRRALHAIYAFCRLADDLADDPDVRGDRGRLLERWSEELDATYAGRPTTAVGVALADSVARYAIPRAWLGDLLAGVRHDVEGGEFARFSEVEHYCYCVASTVGLCVVAVLGHRGAAETRFAIEQGIAVQLTNILRDVGADAREGRLYLAVEDLEHFGVARSDIEKGQGSEGLAVVLACYAARARARYAKALAVLPASSRRTLRPALAMGAIYRALLDRMTEQGLPLTAAPLRLSRSRRLAIAARVFLGGGLVGDDGRSWVSAQ